MKWPHLNLMFCNIPSSSMSCSFSLWPSQHWPFFLFFIVSITRCSWSSWTISANMTSLETTKACGLTQPSIVVAYEMFSNAILRNMSILLKIVTNVPFYLIVIIGIFILLYLCFLVWCPLGIRYKFICFMSILLTIVAISFKSLCA